MEVPLLVAKDPQKEAEGDGSFSTTCQTQGDEEVKHDSQRSPSGKSFIEAFKMALLQPVTWSEMMQRDLQGTHRRAYGGSTTQEHESLDYDVVCNEAELRLHDKRSTTRSVWGFTGTTFVRWALFAVLGAVVGLAAVAVETVSDKLHLLRSQAMGQIESGTEEHFTAKRWAILSLFNLLCVAIAATMVLFIEPAAAGSGISDVMTYLNGTHVSNLFRLRTVVVKLIGVMLAVGSSLVAGPEGPLIVVGAGIASGLTRGDKLVRAFGKTFSFGSRFLRRFHHDLDRRDFIAAGGAAGLAAAFGAPVGGVLFALEEEASFWDPAMTWRTFICTSVACFVLSYVKGEFGTAGILQLTSPDVRHSIAALDMGVIAILGIIGGLLGALFNILVVKLSKIRPKLALWRLCEVLVISLITSTILFWLPKPLQRCTSWNPSSKDHTHRMHGDCSSGLRDVVSDLYLGNRESSLLSLLQFRVGWDGFSAAISAAIFYILMLASFGLACPTGLFMPTIVTGVCIGRAAFQMVHSTKEGEELLQGGPLLYGICGAAAMLGGIQRSSVSLVVILIEGSQDASLVMPIILATALAKWTGDRLGHSLYHSLIHSRKVPWLDPNASWQMRLLQVRDAMAHKPTCIEQHCTIGRICDVLSSDGHNGFPVVHLARQRGNDLNDSSSPPISSAQTKLYRGMILRRHLRTIIAAYTVEDKSNTGPNDHSGVFHWTTPSQSKGSERQREEWIGKRMRQTFRSRERPVENSVDAELRRIEINLGPYMNQGAFCVQENCNLAKAYQLFRALGLRHLPVVNMYNHVTGIITRKDLINHRSTAPPPLQAPPTGKYDLPSGEITLELGNKL